MIINKEEEKEEELQSKGKRIYLFVLLTLAFMVIVINFSINVESAPDNDWEDTDFVKRMNITFGNVAGETLIDYPVYTNLTHVENMQGDFDDLRIYNASCGETGGLITPYEVANFTFENSADLYVNVNSFPVTGRTFCIYYNNSGVSSGENVYDTWNSNYVSVTHLEEDPGPGDAGDYKDSSGYGNNMTPDIGQNSDDTVCGTLSKVGCATNLQNQHIVDQTTDSFPTGTGGYTWMGWVRLEEASSGYNFFSTYGTSTTNQNMMIYSRTSNDYTYLNGNSGDPEASVYNNYCYGKWCHYAGTTEGDDVKLYLNGNLVGSDTGGNSISLVNTVYYIGEYIKTNLEMRGQVDQVKVLSGALSIGAINQTYTMEEFTTSTEYVDFGSEETYTPVAGDSCTYSGSGDFNVDLADNCVFDTNIDVDGTCKFYGTGGSLITATGRLSCDKIERPLGQRIQITRGGILRSRQ